MRPHSAHDGTSRRGLRPSIETLEGRELPSAMSVKRAVFPQSIVVGTTEIHVPPQRADRSPHYHPSGGSNHNIGFEGRGRLAPFLDPKVIEKSANALYGPNGVTPMTPSPKEVSRQELTARWTGTYSILPPRFSDRASTIFFNSKNGGGSPFLKAKFQMVLFPPADPGSTPDPGNPYRNQVTGVAGGIAQNYLQTGGLLEFDLNGTPEPGSDPRALPTKLAWTIDTTSAGPFTTPQGYTQGAGVADIKYFPDRTPVAGTLGSGHFIVSFQGVYNFSQLISSISKVYA
ncbi:MAG: hypothetical protein NVSMB9_25230 [Isosphaeraceae bacterium]